ncbi:MAG: N-acetylmuramoyl-L-alanine amidase, partial [Acidobacteriota bacterium]
MARRRHQHLLIPLVLCLCPLAAPAQSTVEVYDLRSYTHPTHTRIVVDIGRLREFSFDKLKDPDRIYVDIFQARLNPILHGKTYSAKCDYLQEIRIAQKNATTVRMVAEVDFAKVERYDVFPLFDPFRIVVDIFPREATPASPTSPAASPEKETPPPQPTQQGYSLIRQLGLGIRTIVIDPGHGGEDPGAIGSKGLKEKDVALDVALELRSLLAAKGLDVVMTRETDIY